MFTEAKSIAVIGLSDNPAKPSHYVSAYMQQHGYKIYPINPAIPEVLGEKTYATLTDLAAAGIKPDIVNVFEQAVTPGAAPGLHLVRLGDRPAGDAIALSVLAWVRNVAYDKDVWVDLYVLGEGGVLHAETIPLEDRPIDLLFIGSLNERRKGSRQPPGKHCGRH